MTYLITITTARQRITYAAIGDRNALMDQAIDTYGVCGISVRPQ